MSFSSKIKEELAEHFATARHCNLAELSAIVRLSGIFADKKNGGCALRVHTENFGVARKCFTLLRKTFNIGNDILVRRNMATGNCSYFLYAKGEELLAVRNAMTQSVCCKRAYIRGAFLAAGSVSDPSKSYHFEIVCSTEEMAHQICDLICSFSMDAKIVLRKKSYVVYLKEGAQIVDILNIMEAHVSLMELENVRILKEMRNSVNRKVNCETANINKTVSAAVKQLEDITYLRDQIGFENIPKGLVEAALARLEHPEATLKELGESLNPPVGKSGINHRLRKLSEMADKVRQEQGGLL